MNDGILQQLIVDIIRRVKACDPAHGRWGASGEEATILIDASSLAVGVALMVDGHVIEDASWLRANDVAHIKAED